MTKKILSVSWLFGIFLVFCSAITFADAQPNLIQEVDELKAQNRMLMERLEQVEKELNALKPREGVSEDETVRRELKEKEKEGEQEKKKIVKLVSPYLDNLNITGGVSGGYFSTTNEGIDNKASNFVLSNLLLELSSEMDNGLLGFTVGLGGVTTPSVFDAPNDTTPDFRIEYASVKLKPIKALEAFSIEAGLLEPNSGYEDTYTFNSPNIMVGALASQQPYNAVGSRITYAFSEDLELWGGMFRHRLDDDEYRIDYYDRYGELVSRSGQDSDSWEAGISGSLKGLGFNLYHYQLNNLRHLTGLMAKYTLSNVYMVLNVDYWRWSNGMDKYFKDDSSIGAALYIVPSFDKWSFPLRLEYIDQGKSRIYLDSIDADNIYSATFTPTYNFTDNVYLRGEVSYTSADKGFSDDSGRTKDNKYFFAVETGVKF
ncbi:MAG: outer membrane beta-barrel protein [Dissulfurimicrobium sp.]|uniref:outer membrane beta-barrel protein n=1 Tax=Dissulfurimicrobium sp. TaxID=2022436 RepID=UPI004049623B